MNNEKFNSLFNGLLSKSLFALSKAFFDKSKACSRCFQNSPFRLKQLKALIFRFAKIYLQKSALMTAQRDLDNSPSRFDTAPLENNPKWHGSLAPVGEERECALREVGCEDLQI